MSVHSPGLMPNAFYNFRKSYLRVIPGCVPTHTVDARGTGPGESGSPDARNFHLAGASFTWMNWLTLARTMRRERE